MARRLVGRKDELGLLSGALDGLSSGKGGVVAVAGEAGVGKSRLVAEAMTLAAGRGVTVLAGRAVDGSTSPLRPLAEAFLAAFRDAPPPDDPALVPFRAALAPLVPEWQSGPAASTEPLVRNEGVLRLLRALGGRRGCVLVLEDLHWADAETLTLVGHLADHAAGAAVLCLCTVRSEAPSPGLALVRSAAPRGLAEVIELGRLSDGDVAELARAAGGDDLDPRDQRAVCERAEGLPLLVEDLLATARTTGAAMADLVPLTFAATVEERLAALGPDAVEVVRAAAVLGRRFDWRLLGPAAALDEAAVATALRAATEAQLVVASPHEGFAFHHALTRDAVLAGLLPVERSRLAVLALAAVEEAHSGLSGEWCDLAARLSHEAGDDRRAGALLLEVGRRALAEGALAAAEAAVERARGFGAHDDALIEVDQLHLEILSLAGKTDLALELGASLLSRQGAAAAAATHLRLARAAAAATRWDVARGHLADARRLTPAHSDVVVHADALEATVAITEGQVEDAVLLAERALAVGRASGVPEVVCEALEVLGRAARVRDLDRAETLFAQAAETAKEAGLRLWEIRALHELGTIDMLRTSKLDRLERARELASDAGALAIAAVVDLQIASSYALQFEAEAALRTAARGVEVAGLFDLGLTLPMLIVMTACAHATAGRRAEMEDAIARAAELGRDHPEVWVVAWGHSRALLALLEEDRPAADAALREALAWSRRPECGIAGAFGGWLALVATLDAADGDAVRTEARDLGGMGLPINRSLLGYADAIVLGRAGRAHEATELVAAMDELLRGTQGSDGWRHLGRRLVAQAAVSDGWGDPAAWLREALPWFDERGHARVAGACRDLLAQAGAPVPRRGRGVSVVPPELVARGVTSRETDVLGLVGEGLGNQDIAERLYLSPRTVEKHVERLRDKTGATSRAELAELAARYGVVVP